MAINRWLTLLERKAAALQRVRGYVQRRALLEIWLYVHIPLTFVLIARWLRISSASSSPGRGVGYGVPLRNISYSADGRQIVRTSRIIDDLLKIGRDRIATSSS